ncbi:MAG: hypothetical protein ACYC3I_27495, partial [Gemmataceae bacterium]
MRQSSRRQAFSSSARSEPTDNRATQRATNESLRIDNLIEFGKAFRLGVLPTLFTQCLDQCPQFFHAADL